MRRRRAEGFAVPKDRGIRRRTPAGQRSGIPQGRPCGMAAAGGPARGTATPRERGSPHPTSAKARRDELDQGWPRAPAPSAVSRAPASGRSAGRRTRPRRRTRVRQAGRRTRPPARPGAGQHGCRRSGGTETRHSLATLRAHPLARDEGQADHRLERGRLFCRAHAYTMPARWSFSSPSAAKTSLPHFRIFSASHGKQKKGGVGTGIRCQPRPVARALRPPAQQQA